MVRSVFLIFLIFISPIDWFYYTGIYLRELGAKPAIIILLGYFVYALIPGRLIFIKKDAFNWILTNMIALGFGAASFLFTYLVRSGLEPLQDREPVLQFFYQTIMWVSFIFITLSAYILFKKHHTESISIFTVIRISVLIHLSILLIEFFASNIADVLLSTLFRTSFVLIDRPSGFMSEPSYYGFFAGVFGPILYMDKRALPFDQIVGIFLVLMAFFVGAKTVVPVVFMVVLFLFWIGGDYAYLRKWLVPVLMLAVPFIFIFMSNTKVLDLDVNMSSIYRIGSMLTGLRAFLDSSIIFGIGIGQFHFLYSEYMPDFLMVSDEAMSTATGLVSSRASTFSWFIRVLLEFGVVGFFLVMYSIYCVARKIKKMRHNQIVAGSMLFGSLGFLMTQDTYCLPMLAISIGLILSDGKIDVETKNIHRNGYV